MNRRYKILAPRVGFEPTTLRLTAECSAVELPRNVNIHLCKGKLYSNLIYAQARIWVSNMRGYTRMTCGVDADL